MSQPRQGDLFQSDEQPELYDDESQTPVYEADPDEVRAELHKILAEMRASETLPWDERRTALYWTIFPQMTGCLPEEEGAQLRFEFMEELKRLKAA
jgi:hypothetical protein